MLDVRQLWRGLHGVPQLLLVQPDQLGYDLAYALALLPLVVAGIVFFLRTPSSCLPSPSSPALSACSRFNWLA